MGVIQINNSYVLLKNFPENILNSLKSCLTYTDEEVIKEKSFLTKSIKRAEYQGTKKRRAQLKYRLKQLGPEKVCLLKNNKFPTGLLPKVISKLKKIDYLDFKVEDKRVKPTPELTLRWNNKPFDLRYYQKESFELSKKKERGVFALCIGSGKTRLMTEIIKDKEVPTLIIPPSLALVGQIAEELELAFGSSKVEILDSATVKRRKKFKPIRIINIGSVVALVKSGNFHKVSNDLGMVMIDEIHHAGADSYIKVLGELDHVYYRYGFSGTFIRNDSKTLPMHGVLSNVLYYYPPKQALEDGFLTPSTYYIHEIEGLPSKNYQTEYNQNYCGSPAIIRKIKEIVKNGSDQILILVDRKDQSGKIIHKALTKKGYKNSYISGDDSKEVINKTIDKFNNKEINILIGSSVIGEGVNIHSTKDLILATGGKSEIKFVQAVGRAVRLSPEKSSANIHDFNFAGTFYLEKHLTSRLDSFKRNFAGNVIFS